MSSTLFGGVVAWFSQSVPVTDVTLWESHGGVVTEDEQTAQFLFSNDPNIEDTKSATDDDEDPPFSVFRSGWISFCIENPSFSDSRSHIANLGRFLLLAANDEKKAYLAASSSDTSEAKHDGADIPWVDGAIIEGKILEEFQPGQHPWRVVKK